MPQFVDRSSTHEYRIRFDADGRILAKSLHCELGERLGIALSRNEEPSIHQYIERLEVLDKDLPRRLSRRIVKLVERREEFSLHGDCVADHAEYHVHISGRAIEDTSGDVAFALLFIDDTENTRQRRLYELMFRLANHELKSPLMCILGAAEYAEEHATAGSLEGIKTCLQMIERNARSMEEMIQRYLNLSRIESGLFRIHPVETVFSQEVLNPLVSELQPALLGKGMTIEFECAGLEHEPIIIADTEALAIVVRNLLSNAIKYGAANTAIRVLLICEDSCAEVAVENEGPNIPDSQMKKLFHKFVRLEATQGTRGAGLGLYNARKLVESWGGTIRVESHHNRARFTFTVPEG